MANEKTDCALMGCEIPDESLSLGEIIKKYPNTQAEHQARLLIDNHGFKESDKFCDDCFWK
jgi:hypothetical protein